MLALYNFRILYVKGSENAKADALSRKPEYLSNKTHKSRAILRADGDSLVFNKQQLAVTTRLVGDPWTDKIRSAYTDNAEACRQEHVLGKGFARTSQGLLIFLGKIYIPITL
jgi:hypothetical protein